MVFSLNGKLMSTVAYDNTADCLLENILSTMEDICLSKSQAMAIIGCGEKKLESLCESGMIRTEKPTASQNGKWRCNGSDVLKLCRPRKKRRR